MAVFIQKESRHSTILTLWNFDHGLASVVLLFLIIQILPPLATAQLPNALPPPPPDPFSRLRFDKTMAIIMVILVVVFFILGFLSVYTRQCAERRTRGRLEFTIQLGGSDHQSRRGARGLNPEVIDTFPTLVYSKVKGLKIGTSALECAVCLNEFKDDETLRLIPKCNHVFHPDCIDLWLISHSTCPVCRANLVPPPGEISLVAIQIPDPGVDWDEPDRRSEHESQQNTDMEPINENRNGVVESPKVNLLDRSRTLNQNRPTRSRSTGFSFARLFPRSHSTGHSLVQPGENCERFTLRLPEEVRNNLLNSTLNRTKSCVTFARVSSERRGYRTTSVGSGSGRNNLQYERFGNENRSDRRGFRLTGPFFGRSGSSRSAKGSSGSGKPPVERSGVGMDKVGGDRSSDPLFPGNLRLG